MKQKSPSHPLSTQAGESKPLMHFVPQHFLNPNIRISVTLIGAGGSGSQMLSALARIDHALYALGHPGLIVTVYDPDTVDETNVGRQLFSQAEIGRNKAECLVSRFNRIYGLDWNAVPEKFDNSMGNIVISCVDNILTRIEIGKTFRARNITKSQVNNYHRQYGGAAFNEYNENYTFYWLDLGNGTRTGQAILGSNRIPQPEGVENEYRTIEYLPTVAEQFKLEKVDEKESGPSCSMAEALSKQDLFINSSLVQMSASLLWSLLTSVAIDTRGLYLNVETYKCSPIPIREEDNSKTPAKYYKKTKTTVS